MAESSTITRESKSAAADRNRQVLISFALMERNRQQGKGLRLSVRELDVLATVFGDLMKAALAWGALADGPDNPQPDLGAILTEIGQAALATGGAR